MAKSNGNGISNDTATIITVLLLIFVYPIGVVVMWHLMKWQGWIKALVSFPLIILFIFFFFGFFSTFNVSKAKNRALCVRQCQQSYPQNSSAYPDCFDKCAK